MVPGARLTKEQCDPHPEPAFHRIYRGIVGSLRYLVNMTRPDLAWSYSELSRYVQNSGRAHMDAAHHVYDIFVPHTIKLLFTKGQMRWPIISEVGLIQIGLPISTADAHTLVIF